MNSRRVFRFLFILSAFLSSLEAGYITQIYVSSYATSSHVQSNGYCCDAPDSNSLCHDDCDNSFTFCLKAANSDTMSCPLGNTIYQTGNISSDAMEFPQGQDLDAGVPNPLIFEGDIWPGTMDFLVRIEDVDHPDEVDIGNGDPLIAIFIIPIALGTIGSSQSTIYREQGSFLGLSINASCTTNYYSGDCSKLCVPKDDESGHYMCDNQGNKVCVSGYQDLGTNCTQCSLAPGCSPFGGYCNSTQSCICKEHFSGVSCSECENGYSGTNCSECADRFSGPHCSECRYHYAGKYCTECMELFTGEDCKECSGNFAGINCTECKEGFVGENCTECVGNYAGIDCTDCKEDFVGENCAECRENSSGVNCSQDILPCSQNISSSCENGGTCINHFSANSSLANFSCACPDGYEGSLCEKEIYKCMPDHCQNGGTCEINEDLGTVRCVCTRSHSGEMCEKKRQLLDFMFPFFGAAAFSVILLLLIFILLLILCCICHARSKNKTTTSNGITGVENPCSSISELNNASEACTKSKNTSNTTRDSELLDNPIYDRPMMLDSLQRDLSPISGNRSEHYSKLQSLLGSNTSRRSSRDLPGSQMSSAIGRSCDSFGTLQHSTLGNTDSHDYEEIEIKRFRSKKMARDGISDDTTLTREEEEEEEDEMVTVVNASYEALPCHMEKKNVFTNHSGSCGFDENQKTFEVEMKRKPGYQPSVKTVVEQSDECLAKNSYHSNTN